MGPLEIKPDDRVSLSSKAAIPCFRDAVTEAGRGKVWFVMMDDGYLVDCGTGPKGEARSRLICAALAPTDKGAE